MTRNRRTLDLRFALVSAVTLAMAGGGLFLLYRFQDRRLMAGLLVQADRAEEKGDLDRAEKYLARYALARPQESPALARYALLLDRRASNEPEHARALEMLNRVLGRAPERADLRRRAAELSMRPAIAQYREARDHLAKLLEAQPEDAEVEELLGRCHEALAGEARDPKLERTEAESHYRRAIELDPARVESYARLAVLLRDAGKPAAADALMDAHDEQGGLIDRNRQSAPAFLARARYRARYGLQGAAADVRRALELAPEDLDAALAFADLGDDPGRARGLLESCLERQPGERLAYLRLVKIEEQEGRHARAAEILQGALKVLPGDDDLRFLLADQLLAAGRLDEAAEAIADLREQDDVALGLADLLEGRLRTLQGDRPGAIASLERAEALMPIRAELAPLRARGNLMLSSLYREAGDPDRQLIAARRALKVQPDSADARLAVASAMLGQGKTDEALVELDRAGGVLPSAGASAARLLLMRTLALPEDRRDWAEVERALDEVEEADPAAPEVVLLRAEALLARGRGDEARDLITQARDRQPERVEFRIALAELAAVEAGPQAVLEALDEARRDLGDRVEIRLARAATLLRLNTQESRRDILALLEDLDRLGPEDRVRLKEGLVIPVGLAGDVDRARQLAAEVADARPGDPMAASRLFDLLEPGDDEAAREAVSRIRRAEGEDGTIWRYSEAVRLARLAERGQPKLYEQALALVGEVLRRRPEWAGPITLEAQILDKQGQIDRAAGRYAVAIERGERRADVIRRGIQLLLHRGRDAEARRLVQRLSEKIPGSSVLGQLAADFSLRDKDPARALELALGAVRPDSTDYRDHLFLGHVYHAAGKGPEAEAAFRRAAALGTDRPETWIALVGFLAESGQAEPARAAIEEARAKLPADVAPMALGRCLELTGRVDEAAALFRSALQARPDDVRAMAEVISFYIRKGAHDQAVDLLEKILDPKSGAPPDMVAWARRQVAFSKASGRDYAQVLRALELIEANLKADPSSVEDLRIRALLLASQPGSRRDAIRNFEQLARVQPPGPGEKLLLGLLHERGRDWNKAAELIRGALVAEPENPVYLGAMIRNRLGAGRPAEAAPFVDELARLLPDHPDTIELRARLLAAQGSDDEAAALLNALAGRPGVDPLAVAALLEKLGLEPAAEAIFRKAAADPEKPQQALGLAGFLARQGRTAEALDFCEAAAKVLPGPAVAEAMIAVLRSADAAEPQARRVEAWIESRLREEPEELEFLFHQANLRSIQGRYDEAEALQRQIVGRLPNLGGPLNNLAYLLALQEGRASEAVSLIDAAIRLEGANSDYLDTRGLALMGSGRTEEALDDLEEAVALAPSAEKLLHLARGYVAAGRARDAAEALQRARDAGLEPRTLHALERDAYRRLLDDLARN